MTNPIKNAVEALALAKERGGELDLPYYADTHAALEQAVRAARKHDASLDAAKRQPTGADYEHIMSLLGLRTVDSVDDRETAIAAAIESAKQSDENVRRLVKILGLDETVQTSAIAIKADVVDFTQGCIGGDDVTSVDALLDLHTGKVTLTDHSLGYPLLVMDEECSIWHADKAYCLPQVVASGLPDGLDDDEIIEHIKLHGYWAVVDLGAILAGTSSARSDTPTTDAPLELPQKSEAALCESPESAHHGKSGLVSNEVYAALVARNSELETKIVKAHAALRIAHAALFNDSGDGDVHDNAVRAIDDVLIDTHN